MVKIYLAGAESKEFLKILKEEEIEKILISYYACGNSIQQILKLTKGMKIMMDSGAFSAWNKGKKEKKITKKPKEVKIDLQKYIQFIKRYGKNFETYVNLDVIEDAEGTLKNQKIMEKAGLSPLPVYHQNEKIEYLENYCKNYDYVGIGGVAKSGRNKTEMIKFLKKCFKIAEVHNTKLHGFGLTDFELLKKFNFHSVDSTSWLSGSRYGHLYIFDKRRKIMKMYKRGKNKSIWKKYNLEPKNNSLNNKKLDIHNLKQWGEAVVVFDKTENNNSKRWGKEHLEKLSFKKIGNTNAVKTAEYCVGMERLCCDFCYVKDKCTSYEKGCICCYDKEIINLNSKTRTKETIAKIIKERINTIQKRLKRIELFERVDGGQIDSDAITLTNQLSILCEKLWKIEQLKN
ncbi:MAG: hypothetical protein ABIA74_05290 [bacterium]